VRLTGFAEDATESARAGGFAIGAVARGAMISESEGALGGGTGGGPWARAAAENPCTATNTSSTTALRTRMAGMLDSGRGGDK
jgi:hypothetical protein